MVCLENSLGTWTRVDAVEASWRAIIPKKSHMESGYIVTTCSFHLFMLSRSRTFKGEDSHKSAELDTMSWRIIVARHRTIATEKTNKLG